MVNKPLPKHYTLIFMHIPKTAGITATSIIERHYKKEESYSTSMSKFNPDGSLDGFDDLPAEHKARLKLLFGHLGFGIHKKLAQPATYIAILRDPIERVISNYYYDCRETRGPLYNLLKSGEMDLISYVERHASWEMDNLQTRMISGNWHKRGFGPCTEEMLETAKKNLCEHFAVVGITERFDETYLLLKRKFGWPHVFYLSRNVTKNRPPRENIPEADLAVIRKYNQFDIRLYQFTQERFEDQIKQQGISFDIELKLFRFVQTLNKPYLIMRDHAIRFILQIRRFSIRVFVRNLWQQIHQSNND